MAQSVKPLLILNDLHIGTDRSAGTTMASAAALKTFLNDSLRDTLVAHPDKDVLVLGDLFDKFSEDEETIRATFATFHSWLLYTNNELHLVQGNHDVSAKADKLSSFHLLCAILKAACPGQVHIYRDRLAQVREGLYVIGHCMNQDLFDLELEKATELRNVTLMLHANIMNPFAEQADHSLNVNEAMARRLAERNRLVFAHEHQRRCITFREEGFKQTDKFDAEADVIVLGNQFPSSIADCLPHGKAQQDGKKFAHVFDGGALAQIQTWTNQGNFIQVAWTDLAEIGEERFIRVTGNVSQEQAAAVVTAIAKYRSKSNAFVITNGVKIEGFENVDELEGVSLESIKQFDVLSALLEVLEPKEREVVQKLMAEEVVTCS